MNLRVTLCVAAAALFSSCGNPGVPLPPSLELATPVTDLRAVRKGDKVVLTWTPPTLTTDRHNIQHPGATEICRAVASTLRECGTPVSKVAPAKIPASKNASKPQASFTDELPATTQAGNATFNYAVSVLNSYGKGAGLSNQVQVPAAPTLPAPSDFRAELTAGGVQLTWAPISSVPELSGIRFSCRVYRREQGSNKDAVAGEVPLGVESASTLLDHTFEWEKTYTYHATVVTFVAQAVSSEQQVEGDDSPVVTIIAHDIFPPASPAGLQAVFSGPGQKPFVDLIWTANSESDLAGYNVYRHEQGREPIKLNSDPVRSPAYRDMQVLSSHQYFYSITAIDARGNESPHSDEASENVP
jgi:hypothetical protein